MFLSPPASPLFESARPERTDASADVSPDLTPVVNPGHVHHHHPDPVLPRLDKRMSVRAAYTQCQRRHTPFGQGPERAQNVAGLSRSARRYLHALFGAVDQAVVLRAESLVLRQAFARSRDLARVSSGYQALRDFFRELRPPATLRVAHQLVSQAVELQFSFFRACDAGEADPRDLAGIGRHRDVRAASEKLQGAHWALMTTFPDVSVHNRQAFHHHLAALDFI